MTKFFIGLNKKKKKLPEMFYRTSNGKKVPNCVPEGNTFVTRNHFWVKHIVIVKALAVFVVTRRGESIAIFQVFTTVKTFRQQYAGKG